MIENDKELAAIRACWAVLDSLDHAARMRVVTWLQSRVWAEKREHESRPSVVEDTDDIPQ